MKTIQQTIVCGAIACAVVLGSLGCASPKGETPQAKREYVLNMKDKALATVYAKRPEAQSAVEGAPGYMVINNATKQVTYIRLFHMMPGFGIAGKGYKEIVVFQDADTLNKFTTGKWDTGGNAEAAFNFGDTGGSALASGSFEKKAK